MFVKPAALALLSVLSLATAYYGQRHYAGNDEYHLAARDYNYDNDDFSLYARDAAADFDDDYASLYARDLDLDDDTIMPMLAKRAVCKRDEILTKRGCIPSKPVRETTPSHCADVFVDNGPNHVPRQSRIDCYRRVKCKGAQKSYVGLNPLLEREHCLQACTCP